MTPQIATTKNTQELTDADFCESKEEQAAPPIPKRQYPRRAAKWQVFIKTTQGKVIEGRTINVSKEGMLVSLPYNIKLGEKAFIDSVVLYKGSRLNLQGVALVRHNSINGSLFNIGFQFSVATDLTTRFLSKYASDAV